MRYAFRALLLLGLFCSLFKTQYSFAGTPKAENLLSARRTLFTENKGQIADQHGKLRSDVKYLYAAPGLRLALKANGFSYEVIRTERFAKAADKNPGGFQNPRGLRAEGDSLVEHSHRVDISFVGANANPAIISEQAAPDYKNYYLAHTPEEGVTNVRSFAKLTYKNLYPNIDVVFYAREEGKLKYDFVLHPGARLSDIKMQYAGQQGMTAAGTSLKVHTSQGEVREAIPASYYEGGGPVEVKYELAGNTISFASQGVEQVGRKLVIDPVLTWEKYFSGSNGTYSRQVAADRFGNAYITGLTFDYYYISTSGTHQSAKYSIYTDAFIQKYSPGGKLLWGTYFGGEGSEESRSIAIDKANDCYITGSTMSTKAIVTSGAYQTSLLGSQDIFIAKFTTSGLRKWATYYGGGSYEIANDIVLDSAGYGLYLTGETDSRSNIATPGVHQETLKGAAVEAFLAKFDSSGSRLWATYFGGTGKDIGYGVALCADGSACITGETGSASGIATSGAYSPALKTGRCGFLARFSAGGKLLWGTYFGLHGKEIPEAIVSDGAGSLYIAGKSIGDSGLASAGAHQRIRGGTGGTWDAFLAKFDSSGTYGWGTYYGGTEEDEGTGVALDKAGNVYLLGQTHSDTGIATPGAHKDSLPLQTGSDAFLAKFTAAGKRLWGTYYGNYRDSEWPQDVAVSDSGAIFITGHRKIFQKAMPGFLVKFVQPCPAAPARAKDTLACAGLIKLSAYGAIRYRWFASLADTMPLDTNNSYAATLQRTDTFYVAGYDGLCESLRDTVVVDVLASPNATWRATHLSARQYRFLASDTAQASYAWTFGDSRSDTGYRVSHSYAKDSAYTVSLKVTSAAGCTATSSDTVLVRLTSLSDEIAETPLQLSIQPNPFRESATLSYTLKQASRIRLQVFDAHGRSVASLADATQPAGAYSYTLNAVKAKLVPGTYLIKLWVDDIPVTRQIMYMR